MKYPEQLQVVYEREPIGIVNVRERHRGKFFGTFVPGDAFERHRGLFDEACGWSRRFDESHDAASLDYEAFDRYVRVIKRLTPKVALPQLPGAIEEFCIHHDLGVEVTFDEPVA